MPEDQTITAPELSGETDLVADLMKGAETPPVAPQTQPAAPKVEEPPKVAVAPPKAPEVKPAVVPAEKKVEKPTIPPKVDKINIDDPKVPAADLRKHLKEVLADKTRTEQEKQTEITKLNGQLKELQGKRFITPDDEKKWSKMEADLKEAQRNLYSRDFRVSPEYKQQYQDKFDSLWGKAVASLKNIPILNGKDEVSGEDKTRQFNQADLLKVFKADVSDQYLLAKQLFGEHFNLAITYVNQLSAIDEQAQQAISDKAKNWETEYAQQQDNAKKQSETFQSLHQQATELILKNHPEFNDKDDEPEANAAAQRGVEMVDKFLSSGNALNPTERAVQSATIRMLAANAPRLLVRAQKLSSRVTELETELSKYRGTDPGAAEGGTTPAAKVDTDESTESFVDELKKLQKNVQ
jgi:hypothetical protein